MIQSLRDGEQKLDLMFAGTAKHFDMGEMVVKEGEPHDLVYKMRSGWAARVRNLGSGRTQIILLFLPGDVFALKSMFMDCHPDSIEALSPIDVDFLHVGTLRSAYERDPDIALRCMAQIVEEERRLHNDIVGLGSGSAAERMAAFLLRVRGRLVMGNVIQQSSFSFELALTQSQISDHLGLSLVHTNKTLMKLRDLKLVCIARRLITITNLAGLVQLGGALLDPDEQKLPAYVGDSGCN